MFEPQTLASLPTLVNRNKWFGSRAAQFLPKPPEFFPGSVMDFKFRARLIVANYFIGFRGGGSARQEFYEPRSAALVILGGKLLLACQNVSRLIP